MKLRLILLVIAVLVIAWIVWDHNRKNVKENKYVDKPSFKDSFLSYLANISFTKQKKNRKTYPNHTNPNSRNSDDDYLDFDTEYELAKNYDGFEIITKDKKSSVPNNYEEYSTDNTEDFKFHVNQVKKFHTQVESSYKKSEMFLVTLHIKALNKKKIYGDTLLQALISVGCRFGEMGIFHRHEKTSGQGQILFSIASMIKPGTFDIENMQSFSTPGITLFFSTPNQSFNPVLVYDVMLKTAYKLAKLLDAEILDDEREPLTAAKTAEIKEILEHYVEEEV